MRGAGSFGFPVRIGVVRIGALNVFRDRSGPLSDDQHADALVMADVIARAILAFQADAEPGVIAVELNADIHTVVHQAAGMVSIQLDVSVGDALARLRACRSAQTGRSPRCPATSSLGGSISALWRSHEPNLCAQM